MAEGTVTVPEYVSRLAEALRERFPDGDVDWEPIRTDRYRFAVVSREFEDMGHPERQDIVWGLTDGVVSRGDILKVGMILTIAPSELPSHERA